jgi:hypothetical protein
VNCVVALPVFQKTDPMLGPPVMSMKGRESVPPLCDWQPLRVPVADGPLRSMVPTRPVQGLPTVADAGPAVVRRSPPVSANDAPSMAVVVTIRVNR